MADPAITEKRALADELYESPIRQARMVGVFIFGDLAIAQPDILPFLRQTVSRDSDWRVQEILAKAFDQFCADTGYQAALPTIKAWLADPHPNVRRAVTEGLRIWTARPYFKLAASSGFSSVACFAAVSEPAPVSGTSPRFSSGPPLAQAFA